MNILEKVMKIWAQITSLVIIGYITYSSYLFISFLFIPIQKPIWMYSMPLVLIFGLIFYSPFFYYGWVKKPNDEHMKYFTKFMTIVYSVAVVFISPIFNGLEFYLYLTLPVLAFITPLYYYAWRD